MAYKFKLVPLIESGIQFILDLGKKVDYESDVSGTYTDRSLVDKAYVDKNPNLSVDNGLTNNSGVIELGGTLKKDTEVFANTNTFVIEGDTSSVEMLSNAIVNTATNGANIGYTSIGNDEYEMWLTDGISSTNVVSNPSTYSVSTSSTTGNAQLFQSSTAFRTQLIEGLEIATVEIENNNVQLKAEDGISESFLSVRPDEYEFYSISGSNTHNAFKYATSDSVAISSSTGSTYRGQSTSLHTLSTQANNSEGLLGIENDTIGISVTNDISEFKSELQILNNSASLTVQDESGGQLSSIVIDNTAMTVTDALNGTGLKYNVDYSDKYTNRSIVDSGYVKAGYRNITAITNDYTVLRSDNVIEVDASSNTVQVTLPTIAGVDNSYNGKEYVIDVFNADNAVTLVIPGVGTETLLVDETRTYVYYKHRDEFKRIN